MAEDKQINFLRLIFIPSLISLAVTLLRLVGELQHWADSFFTRGAGGPLAIIGIVWLAPLFGIYFALKLMQAGAVPGSRQRVIWFSLLAVVLIIGLGIVLPVALKFSFYARLISGFAVTVLAALMLYPAWPALFKALLLYGLAARIPVAIIMWFAMQGNWGTHYDASPPDLPAGISLAAKYVWIGLIPQLSLWVAFTIITGMLFGTIAASIVYWRKPVLKATA